MTIFQGNRELLDAFRFGEAAALRKVYLHYIQEIELFINQGWYNAKQQRRTCGVTDFEVQMELVQEIFMRAFSEKSRIAYDGIRPYKVFLLGIARNTLIDYIRKRPADALSYVSIALDSEELGKDPERFLDNMKGETPEQEADIDWQRCVAATELYVRSLDGFQKQFVELRFQKELTLVEVARQLGITRGKARGVEKDLGRRLKRHLQALKIRVTFFSG